MVRRHPTSTRTDTLFPYTTLCRFGKTAIEQMDFASSTRLAPPVEQVVHGFSWLRDLAASGAREQCADTAERVSRIWLDANPEPAKGAAWQVEHAGQRLLAWLVHAPLILSGRDDRWRRRMLGAMETTDRKSVVEGKRVSVRVESGGRPLIKK